MPRKKKNTQQNTSGCKVCGNPDIGRGILKHLKGMHNLKLADYKKCFKTGQIIVDKLVESGTAGGGKKRVVMHVLVRKFTLEY
jgi:hypothetical protein